MQLSEQNFRNLLLDIYGNFAPHKIDMIDSIIEKYNKSFNEQQNAIQMAFLKYVTESNPNYHKLSNILPKIGTEKNISQLMQSYQNGDRIISEQAILDAQNTLKQLKEQQIKDQQLKEELINKNNKNTQALEEKIELLNEKLTISLGQFQNYQQELNQEISNYINQEVNNHLNLSDVVIEIESYEEPFFAPEENKFVYKEMDVSNIVLPSQKILTTLSIGQRLIVKNLEGKVIGVEVKNICDDYVSVQNKTIRSLQLRKI